MTNTPLQSRSQKTLDNILHAATELLEEKSFEEMTIQDIVDRAGCSVGAFYGRLKDKDALLHALDARYIDGQLEAARFWLKSQSESPGSTLEMLLQSLLALFQEALSRDRGLLRTLILRARILPDPRFREQEARLNEVGPEIIQAILEYRSDITHPQPEIAVQVGFFQAYMALREAVAWPHIGANFPLQGKALSDEFARSFHSYLTS